MRNKKQVHLIKLESRMAVIRGNEDKGKKGMGRVWLVGIKL
jgi:hypothetical protein